MDEHTATEQSYKNGYQKGYDDAKAELVYCKECRSWSPHWLCGDNKGRCVANKPSVTDGNHFCSYGRRKNE